MQIQPIMTSQSSYKGHVFYSGEYYLTAKWNRYMPVVLRDIENDVVNFMKDKPFDLYLLKSKDKRDAIEVIANINYSNIVSDDSLIKSKRRIFVKESMPADIYIEAIKDAVAEFENLLKNKQSKTESFFARVVNIFDILREKKG